MIIWIITVVFDSVIDFCFNWEFVLQEKQNSRVGLVWPRRFSVALDFVHVWLALPDSRNLKK